MASLVYLMCIASFHPYPARLDAYRFCFLYWSLMAYVPGSRQAESRRTLSSPSSTVILFETHSSTELYVRIEYYAVFYSLNWIQFSSCKKERRPNWIEQCHARNGGWKLRKAREREGGGQSSCFVAASQTVSNQYFTISDPKYYFRLSDNNNSITVPCRNVDAAKVRSKGKLQKPIVVIDKADFELCFCFC
jgi:hypothetical protein